MQAGEKKAKNLANLGLSLKGAPENEEMEAWGFIEDLHYFILIYCLSFMVLKQRTISLESR